MFSVYLKDSRSSHLLPSRNRRCPGFLGLGFRLLLRRAGSHSITYLCDNITAEKPSKQPCSQMKPAASTAKCSSGVIVLQLLVATIVHVHISFFSHSYVTCYTFTSVYDFEVIHLNNRFIFQRSIPRNEVYFGVVCL